jgi:hypothetical protein
LNIPIWTKYRRQKREIESIKTRLREAEQLSDRRYGYFLICIGAMQDISNVKEELLGSIFHLRNGQETPDPTAPYSIEQLIDMIEASSERLRAILDEHWKYIRTVQKKDGHPHLPL